MLALATPVGLLLASLRPHMSFLLARNLIPSLVPAAIVISWLVSNAGRRASIATGGVVIAVLAFGAAQALQQKNRRTPYRRSSISSMHGHVPGIRSSRSSSFPRAGR